VVSKSRIWGTRRKGLSILEGLLAVVGLEVTPEGIRTGTGTERWRERVANFRGCDAETASAKWCADKRSGEKISVGETEGTSGMTGMQGWTSESLLGRIKSKESEQVSEWRHLYNGARISKELPTCTVHICTVHILTWRTPGMQSRLASCLLYNLPCAMSATPTDGECFRWRNVGGLGASSIMHLFTQYPGSCRIYVSAVRMRYTKTDGGRFEGHFYASAQHRTLGYSKQRNSFYVLSPSVGKH